MAQVRDPKHDAPTIGILLCKTKKKTIVEYALRGIETPMGVSTYRTSPKLPNELVGLLPTLEQLEEQLRDNDDAQPDMP
jgi:YhcG PDDEXK nuclease domain